MSVEKVARKDGSVVWRVRWRQAGQNRAKVLGRKRDAEAFDAELKRRRRLGELGLLDAGNERLVDFAQDWWKLYAEPNLSQSTLRVYAQLWDAHILPRLGQLRLRELTVETLQRYRLELQRDGVGQASARKALVMLQGMLQRAVEWGRLQSNPMVAIKKPPAARKRLVQPLSPEVVEMMRALALEQGLMRDATLLSLLAYAGLRPGRGSRSPVVERPGAHPVDRLGRLRWPARADQDAARQDSAASETAGSGPCGMAPEVRAASRRRARVPAT